ncbi:switch-associated protein 70-like [Lineus longissimus]|uniref:switch-associated protein 70-like n=1 Tax=Lineus longissimus TaxID=88925 RepID=UPI002B4E6A0B
MNLNNICDQTAVKMAAFQEKRKCIWHAFNALDEQGLGVVPKTQLKVLTHNISNSLGYTGAEEQLDIYVKDTSVSSKDYLEFLAMVVFDAVDVQSGNANFNKVDDVCWMLCARKYRNKDKDSMNIRDKDAFKLWKVFNLLVECNEKNELILPLAIDFEEVEILYQKLMHSLGKAWDSQNIAQVRQSSGSEPANYAPKSCSFQLFLDALEVGYLKDVGASAVSHIVDSLFKEMMDDVIKKGWLTKKGHIVGSWKERWFVLTPNSLTYYTGEDERETKGEVPILSTCKIEALNDKTGGKPNRFLLVSESRPFELSTKDLKTKNEWITALQEAIGHTKREVSYQKSMLEKRRAERVEKRKLLREEAQRKQEMEERLMNQAHELEAQKQEIADAQARYEEELAHREAEEERRKELEEMQLQLQKMLEDERQAKKDEEVVRALKEQLLEEEQQARFELERLKAQQDEVIEAEKQRRAVLEQSRQEQEAMLEKERQIRQEQAATLEQERSRLEKMELERKEADEVHAELEKLKAEQDRVIEAERQKRAEVEQSRQEQEAMLEKERQIRQEQMAALNQERLHLEKLELERRAADERLQEASVKLLEAEKQKQELEAKVQARKEIVITRLAGPITPQFKQAATHRGDGAFPKEFLIVQQP